MSSLANPGMLADPIFGVHRGVIEDVSDPEQRKRYRVRVVNVHPPAVDKDHLPWAELAGGFGGSTFGDIPAYELDDEVWIAFEGGNRRFPVIMGGILNFAGGVPPIPPEQTGDEEVAQRWIRVDRKGNKIEMSPLDDELWIRLVTPDGSEVRVSAADGSILLSAEGRVRLVAPNVQIEATEEMNVATPRLIADVTDECTIRGGDIVNIRGATEINIGEYLPPDTTGLGIPVPETSTTVNVKAVDLVKIESADLIDIDAGGDLTCDVQGNITVYGAANATVTIDGDVLLDVEGNVEADIEGTTTINSAGKIQVDCQAEIEVNAETSFLVTAGSTFDIQATTALTIDGQTTIDVTAGASMTIEAQASLDITATGPLSLESSAQLSLDAPVIQISASALLDLDGGGSSLLGGGVILIG